MKRLLITCVIALAFACTAQAQTAEIDPRIKLYYSEAEIQEMVKSQPAKIKQLNFYFASSYIAYSGPIQPLTAEEIAKIDIKKFEHLRKKDQRAWVGYNRQGAKLELLSQDELDAKYKELEAQK